MGFFICFMEVKSLHFPREFHFFGEIALCASFCTTCSLLDHTYISMFHLQQPSREGTDFKLWKKMKDCSISPNSHLKTINRSIWEEILRHIFEFLGRDSQTHFRISLKRAGLWQSIEEMQLKIGNMLLRNNYFVYGCLMSVMDLIQ